MRQYDSRLILLGPLIGHNNLSSFTMSVIWTSKIANAALQDIIGDWLNEAV